MVPVYNPKPGNLSNRNYSRVDYCYYCEKPLKSRISRHYTTVHSDQSLVKDLLAAQTREQKRNISGKIKNLGNYKHNSRVRDYAVNAVKISRTKYLDVCSNNVIAFY